MAQPGKLRGAKSRELTPREQEVVDLLLEGMCDKDIARALGAGLETVKRHLHNIREKIGMSTRLELVVYFFTKRQAYLEETIARLKLWS